MIIHVVKQGETIFSIADYYKVSAVRIIQENDLMEPNNLVIGQTIIIVYPEQTHTVIQGDTLPGIADRYNVTLMDLLRNNPYLLDREYIYPGEILVIRYINEKSGSIKINGYAYPFIDRKILEKNLLYLTYLSIFSYTISANGELNDIDDAELIDMAKGYGVAPIMVISNVTSEGAFDRDIAHNFLADKDIQDNLIENISSVLKEKGYYGVNLDMPYILPEDRENYIEFIIRLISRLKSQEIKIFITISPNAFQRDEITDFREIDYTRVSQIIDGVILISYSWGYTTGIPLDEIPFNYQQILLAYIETQIPSEKITFGITSIGYIFRFPFIEGVSRAEAISNANAIQLAGNAGTEINYNKNNLTSYFYISNSEDYLVYFHDGRGLSTFLELVSQHNLDGIALWNIMYFLAQEFLIINTQYYIEKVI